jgi:enoyl-CoA hydratase/carnithine racemase
MPTCVEAAIAFAGVVATSVAQLLPAKGELIRLALAEATNVAVIELNDVSHFNALSDALANDLGKVIEHWNAYTSACGFVLQAAGPHFCVGGYPYGKQVDIPLSMLASSLVVTAQNCCKLRGFSSLVVSAVHGHLVGGGIALSLNGSNM